MKANQLEKAAAILPKIYALDKEVVVIEKKCLEIINDEKHTAINLSFTKPIPEKGKTFSEQEMIDEMVEGINKATGGNRRVVFAQGMFAQNGYVQIVPESGPEQVIKENIIMNLNDTETLIVLNALLDIKKEQRLKLVRQIVEMGVKL